MVGRINHFKHRPGMGCSLLFLAACMIGGFFALVVSLPVLTKHPWIIVVAGISWLGFQIFNGFRESSISSSLNSPYAGAAEWNRAKPREKMEFILRRNKETKSVFPDDVFPDPAMVLACIDSYFLDPSKQEDSISFAMGFASATLRNQANHTQEN